MNKTKAVAWMICLLLLVVFPTYAGVSTHYEVKEACTGGFPTYYEWWYSNNCGKPWVPMAACEINTSQSDYEIDCKSKQ